MNNSIIEQLKNQKTVRQLTESESIQLLSEIKFKIPEFITELEKIDQLKMSDVLPKVLKDMDFCSKMVRTCLSTFIISDIGKAKYLEIFTKINDYLEMGIKYGTHSEYVALNFKVDSLSHQFVVSPLFSKEELRTKAISSWEIIKYFVKDFSNPVNTESLFLVYLYLLNNDKEIQAIKQSYAFLMYRMHDRVNQETKKQ